MPNYTIPEANTIMRMLTAELSELKAERSKILAVKGSAPEYKPRFNKISHDISKISGVLNKTRQYISDKEIKEGLSKNYKESK